MFISLALFAAAAVSAQVPKVWVDAKIEALEVPLAEAEYSSSHISSADYYRIPERVIYRSYPVYHPDREPEGYQEWLATREPEVAFDVSKLESEADWVSAGDIVFNAPTSFGPVFFGEREIRNPKFFGEGGMPVAADGTIPFARWVVREKGKVELGSMGCNTCHTRVMPDGSVVAGAQGNNPGDREGARMLAMAAKFMKPEEVLERIRRFALQFEMPWLDHDPNRRAREMSLDELVAAGEAIPAGVTARAFTSMLIPPQIPDIIGVQERHYLDHAGLVRHREIADLMRYSSLVQDMMKYSSHGEFPAEAKPVAGKGARYSDAQLYALARYVYSLEPPKNPYAFEETARKGKAVFEREGCAGCHAPPLYTNNKLVPADGFTPPGDSPDAVMDRSIGLDTRTALETLKGTGYYKVPSLKGVWYRGPFEHNGSVATLEDWFDPARLREDYQPTGFKGGGVTTRAVPGHRFGLELSAGDKAALLAFLRTL
ncbi:MAG: hypothetical protein R2748_31795 [Bryobacterales bacterium]